MAFAVMYAEGADVVATYGSVDEAREELARFVLAHPRLRDEIGIREYRDGRPVGAWVAASDTVRS